MLKAGICRRFSELDKSGCGQCAPRRYEIFSEQIEVAERTVAWNRIVGGNLQTLHQHQGSAYADRALPRMKRAGIACDAAVRAVSAMKSARTSCPRDRHSRAAASVKSRLQEP